MTDKQVLAPDAAPDTCLFHRALKVQAPYLARHHLLDQHHDGAVFLPQVTVGTVVFAVLAIHTAVLALIEFSKLRKTD
jgi:hypothetical protein